MPMWTAPWKALCQQSTATRARPASQPLFVQEGVYDEFVTKFAAKVKTSEGGNGFEDGVNQGPLIEEAALERCSATWTTPWPRGGQWWPAVSA